jgi:hypothetical protein
MADKTYVDGIETPGLDFPNVHAYTASLKTSDPAVFDKLFKRFLAESVLACIDGEGGVTMDRMGTVVRIYLREEEGSSPKAKKSEFFKP